MSTRKLLLEALQSDTTATLRDDVWEVRCLHCRSGLQIDASGEPLGAATLEHIVPRSWFDKNAARELTSQLSGPSDPRNLAAACARCNHDKGKSHDARGPADPRAREVIATLLQKRAERFKG